MNEGLRKIEEYAFENCSTSLTIMMLQSSVTKVGSHGFKNCTNLREVVLNEGLQEMKKTVNVNHWNISSSPTFQTVFKF